MDILFIYMGTETHTDAGNGYELNSGAKIYGE
jgi:hypothetical protein